MRAAAIVVSGGSCSRMGRPKQFLPLFGIRSTFQETLSRVSDAALFARPIVITNAEFRFVVAEQLRERGIEADIVLEPIRRDSGPAVTVAAVLAAVKDAARLARLTADLPADRLLTEAELPLMHLLCFEDAGQTPAEQATPIDVDAETVAKLNALGHVCEPIAKPHGGGQAI